MLILKPLTCKYNRKILCGVVKNLGNCPFPTDERCQMHNATNFFGMINNAFGSITLKKYRYNHLKVSITVLDNNMCPECRVIWTDPEKPCPICNEGVDDNESRKGSSI